ncbi:hypothetical protein AUC43_09545 [Hymenobacter sedentarius]|uniref:Uncharacterized protein n=1 Tax=Hymenobacter sedentarius TaxID=1411621 RepID=A0A0U4AP42_9BACT|nr:hypothetical protein [Hymenobacter sedentarius]ALW85317.1 hypothetical protein AUC43_09545 [Hymenobacter sedentarius]
MAATYVTNRVFNVPGKLADIPSMLCAFGFDEHSIHHHQDKYADFLSYLVTAPCFNRHLKPGDFVPVNQCVLKQKYGSRYVKDMLHNLTSTGVIECDGTADHRTGKSYGYRIAPDYVSKAVALSPFKPEVLAKRLDAWAALDLKGLRKERFLNRIHKDMKHLRIRHEAAHAHLDAIAAATGEFLFEHKFTLSVSHCPLKAYADLLDEAAAESPLIMLPERKEVAKRVRDAHKRGEFESTYYLVMQQSVRDALVANTIAVDMLRRLDTGLTQRPKVHRKIGRREEYFKEVDGEMVKKFRIVYYKDPTRQPHLARVYTFLTNLATHLRPFLYHVKHEDEVLVNLDIRNSQPFLLNVLLNHRYEGQQRPKDVRRYMRLTASGTFYELVARVHGLRAASSRERREFKSRFFGSVFFCKMEHTAGSQLGQWFMKHFPNVYELIAYNKREAYHNLAIEMQRIEANLVIDVVTTALQTKKIWCASIHDSIVCRPGDQEAVMAILADAFEQAAGIKPSIKPEPLK